MSALELHTNSHLRCSCCEAELATLRDGLSSWLTAAKRYSDNADFWRARAERAEAMVRELEWSGYDIDGMLGACPQCDGVGWHGPDCALAAIIHPKGEQG